MSHVTGADQPPLLDITIGAMLAEAAARDPEGLALIARHQQVRLSWRELKRRTDAVASGLLAAGIERGDRVGIWAPNCVEWTILQFATAAAGMILVTINPAYRSSEAEYALKKVGCRALVTATRHKSSDYMAMLREVIPELEQAVPGALHSANLPDLRLIATLGDEAQAGCLRFDALEIEIDDERLTAIPVHPDDAVNIQFTSGTTGFPKGATLTHRNILNNGYFVGAQMGLTAADRICIPVPLYHCFGMVMGNLACLAHGATMVYPAESFDPLAVLETVAEEGCTALYGVPTMFIAILAQPEFDSFDTSSLRTGIMAGSPCPVATMLEVISRLGMHQVTIGYGMTETSPISFQSAMDSPLEQRVTTVGKVQPHLEVKIVGPDGETLPLGEAGELCTRGYSVMLGYWDDPARTTEAIDAEGWMHSGDIATLDEQGYCRITGRIKDMVIRGGENIYPREIEEFLMTHPAIMDAQVIGVPDERFGEELCAWVRTRGGSDIGEDDVRAHCSGRIAHYKVPKYIRIVSEFPMTVTGKVQKFVMRDRMIAELAG
ncbi:AMP-binding protein [Novosphingobium flavum]|uniref:AMP-binding protein n=1 Tax=Novosphingobium aerophilum TaxID=2839843 RepID=UPI00163AAFC3|nr:AMP-binding protein [Novosphingobium aerophilum]MBC2662785.1 AMP-binding protein [Novosphingobium aerophilum]